MARTGDSLPSATAQKSWLDALWRAPLRLPLFDRGTLAPGWRLERRVIPEHLVYFVARNTCAGQVGGITVELAAGSLLWVPPGVPFELGLAAPRRPITLLRFRLAMSDPPRWLRRPALVLPRAWELRQPMDGVLDELATGLPHREARLRAQLVLLFAGIFRAAERGGSTGIGSRRVATFDAGQSQRLAEYVAARVRERPGPAALAAELRLSHDYFTRVFRRTFGMAPRPWITRERVRHAAARLMDTSINVSELADEFGYPDVFAFSRQFSKVLGCSPRTYRARGSGAS